MTNNRLVLVCFLVISVLTLLVESRCQRSTRGQEIKITAQRTATPSYSVTTRVPKIVEKYDFTFAGNPQIAQRLALVGAANRILRLAHPGKSFRAAADKCPGKNKFLVTIYQVR